MSKLTKIDVAHVADLANFEVSDQEAKKLQKELSETLAFIEKLSEVETKGMDPTSQVTGLEKVTREDVPRPSLNQDQALKNAPETHNYFFKTKPVFNE